MSGTKNEKDETALTESLEEAEISLACLMDEIYNITMEDLEHLQKQLQTISGGE